jgi:hypothetical protein
MLAFDPQTSERKAGAGGLGEDEQARTDAFVDRPHGGCTHAVRAVRTGAVRQQGRRSRTGLELQTSNTRDARGLVSDEELTAIEFRRTSLGVDVFALAVESRTATLEHAGVALGTRKQTIVVASIRDAGEALRVDLGQ